MSRHSRIVGTISSASDFNWEQIVQVIEKNFWNLRSIYSNSERSDQFLKQNAFLTCSWRFLRYDILELLKFKYEDNYWDLKSTGKVRKHVVLNLWSVFFINSQLFETYIESLFVQQTLSRPSVESQHSEIHAPATWTFLWLYASMTIFESWSFDPSTNET